MPTFNEQLEKYAELGVKIGVNVQKGQTLIVNAPISTAPFVRLIAKKAYEAGAKNVHVEWSDEDLTKIKYLNAPDEAFTEFPLWKARGYEEMAENGAAVFNVFASNPDLLSGVDPDRIQTANKAAGQAMKGYREYIVSDKISWTILAAPTKDWAAKVFPDVSPDEQETALWNAIFKATRIDQPDPIQAWKEHDDQLQAAAQRLNDKKYKKLHYKAPGTDLTVELVDGHIWIGGSGPNSKGVRFMANMPTEEVYTMPAKEGVDGYVTSTKPLSYGGNLIENFTLTFEKGRIVDFKAEKGYETLKRLVETDEGSHYLGEVALVPHNSPISNSNVIFFNTLFDENASCHFAIGNAYSTNIQGGTEMSKEELESKGANTSLTHVDFMMGSAEMDIDGVLEDGTIEPIFRNGNWAF